MNQSQLDQSWKEQNKLAAEIRGLIQPQPREGTGALLEGFERDVPNKVTDTMAVSCWRIQGSSCQPPLTNYSQTWTEESRWNFNTARRLLWKVKEIGKKKKYAETT
ncbi:hypothetical protein ATANTOWER_010567 [Ataeniobius toweri]|uniref:Uncharacterized protein n=1 Tax=Ataeniobius toweri TaxID=208326 RepID=A0ABU7BAW2_9TELE|nr:hypothetical protein [Ataeniobius toweri]